MYDLYINDEYFLDFSSLADFNRYSKKWLNINFKNIIYSDDSKELKEFYINMILHKRTVPGLKFNIRYNEEAKNG